MQRADQLDRLVSNECEQPNCLLNVFPAQPMAGLRHGDHLLSPSGSLIDPERSQIARRPSEAEMV